MSKDIRLGDKVKDAINGYEGVVFGIEPDGDKTYIHFKRTKEAYEWGNTGTLQPTNRINIKNIILLGRPEPSEPYVSLEDKVDMILNHLGLKIETTPAQVKLKKVKSK